ncbi:MAG: type II toxin-antitoxin system VapC family toxin [Methylococcales bacterium]
MLTVDASIWVAAEDESEPFHTDCREFLLRAMKAGAIFHQPFLSVIEVSAAIARKTRDAGLGMRSGQKMLATFGLVLHPLGRNASRDAARLATQLFLRGADAVYVATAEHTDSILVTLDVELKNRAAAVLPIHTPAEWLTLNP